MSSSFKRVESLTGHILGTSSPHCEKIRNNYLDCPKALKLERGLHKCYVMMNKKRTNVMLVTILSKQ